MPPTTRSPLSMSQGPRSISLRSAVALWQAALTSLPIALDAYATADVTSAEAYLTVLKRKVAQHQQ